ncbi:MAG: hypothetical protein ACI8SR_000563 [Oceanicoccus sp.]|jgi:hypothetical protein
MALFLNVGQARPDAKNCWRAVPALRRNGQHMDVWMIYEHKLFI